MRRPSRKSAGSSRAEFATRNESSVDFDALVSSVLYNDAGVVKAKFHDHGLKKPFCLGFLAERLEREAARAFATGFVVWANESRTFKGRWEKYKTLRYGLGDFLRDHRTDKPGLGQIATEFVQQFRQHLNERHPANQKHRTTNMAALRKIVDRLRLMDDWKEAVAEEIDWGPRRRNRRDAADTKNKVLSEADYDALWVHVSRKSKRIVALHEKRKAALVAWDGRTPTVAEAGADPIALAVLLDRMFPGKIPPPHSILRREPLGLATSSARWRRARQILMPGIDELLPAIIILTTLFGLNPGVVKGMRHRIDYHLGTSLGRKRIFVHPLKDRGTPKPQRNTVVATEDGDNPARIIRFLEERTAFLRSRIDPPHRAMLMLWLNGLNGASSFVGTGSDFFEALARFAGRRGIKDLQLRKIRPSSLDRVHRITGGDLLKVRDYANHHSIETTFADYESDAMARRSLEGLGGAMLQNDRYLASGGVIRPFLLPSELDKGSATPGYACLDPLNSAIPGEADGVLCKAYGRCPICPLAAIHPTPRAYAYIDALARRVDEALTDEVVSGPEWVGRWAIVKKSIALQMRRFPDETIAAAEREIISELPPLE